MSHGWIDRRKEIPPRDIDSCRDYRLSAPAAARLPHRVAEPPGRRTACRPCRSGHIVADVPARPLGRDRRRRFLYHCSLDVAWRGLVTYFYESRSCQVTGSFGRAFLRSCQSNRPPSRSPSRPPTQERGPRRRPSSDDPDAGSDRHRSPTRAGGFVVAGAVAPTATSIRVGTIRTEHQRLLREAWKRAPLLHFGSRVNPVRNSGRSHQLVGLATLRLPYPQTPICFSCAPSGGSPVSR
jgi:hypothetical protein